MVSRELFRWLGRVGAIISALCVEYRVRDKFHMQRIRIVIDQELFEAMDRVAQRIKRNRSELICEVLREHLRRLEIRTLEDRDRHGYAAQESKLEESTVWEAEAAWPLE